MAANTKYHVILDSQGYIIDLDSYRKSVSKPFAPKTREGDAGYSDLAVPAVWAQESWALGMGFDRWEKPWKDQVGFETGASIDARFGDLRPGRSLTSKHAPTSGTDLYGLIVYRSSLYSFQSNRGEIYASTDGASWTNPRTYGTGFKAAATMDGALFFGNAASGVITKFDGTTWTDVWTTIASTTRITALAAGAIAEQSTQEALWVGHTVTATPNIARVSKVQPGTGTSTIVTFKDDEITALIVWDGKLWIATREDASSTELNGALYTYDLTPATGAPRITPITQLQDNAITAFAVFQGRLYAGSANPDVATIGVGGAGGVSDYAQRIYAMTVDDGRLHVPVVDTNGLGLYSWDGQGWSNVATGGSGQEPRGIAAFKGDVYLTMKSSTQARTYRADRAYPTTATFVSASFDAGLAATEKLFLKAELFHLPLNASESVQVEYELDDSGVWTSLGTSSVDAATAFSANFATGTTGKRIKVRLTLTLVTTTAAPIVTGILVTYLTAPDAKAEWVFDVRLEGTVANPITLLDNTTESQTGAQLQNALWTTRGKKQSLTFTDYDAEAKTVLMVDLEERIPKTESQRLAVSTRGRVTLVEV